MIDQRVLHILVDSLRRIKTILVALVVLLIHLFVRGAALPQGAFDMLLGNQKVP